MVYRETCLDPMTQSILSGLAFLPISLCPPVSVLRALSLSVSLHCPFGWFCSQMVSLLIVAQAAPGFVFTVPSSAQRLRPDSH